MKSEDIISVYKTMPDIIVEERGDTTFLINPNRRCVNCNGREVLTLTKASAESNLKLRPDKWFECKDKKECAMNTYANYCDVRVKLFTEQEKQGIVFHDKEGYFYKYEWETQ